MLGTLQNVTATRRERPAIPDALRSAWQAANGMVPTGVEAAVRVVSVTKNFDTLHLDWYEGTASERAVSRQLSADGVPGLPRWMTFSDVAVVLAVECADGWVRSMTSETAEHPNVWQHAATTPIVPDDLEDGCDIVGVAQRANLELLGWEPDRGALAVIGATSTPGTPWHLLIHVSVAAHEFTIDSLNEHRVKASHPAQQLELAPPAPWEGAMPGLLYPSLAQSGRHKRGRAIFGL